MALRRTTVLLLVAAVLVPAAPPAVPPAGPPTGPAPTATATAPATATALPGTATRLAATASPAVDRAMAARLCGAGRQESRPGPWGLRPRGTDPALAAQLMRGRIPLRGGTFVLAGDPSWRPQRTLDRSGNNGQHGLVWAMPLLREGLRTGDRRMLARFAGILTDWARDNPRARPVTPAAWEDYQVGNRLLTLVCAAAGPRSWQPWVRRVLADHVRVVAARTGWRPTNNASMLSSAGLLAAGCTLRDRRAVTVALGRFRSLGGRLYKADGSDGEGSPAYTYANFLAQADHDARMRACGVVPPRQVRATAAMPQFLAAATRPDGLLEAIGDGGPVQVAPADVAGTPAEYAATRGRSGTAPPEHFARFAGGFVFGRSGWGTRRPFGEETFYSVRTGAGRPAVLHGHADQTALTLFSHGSPLLVDSGVYRYSRNAARSYVVSRRAHTSVTVAGIRSRARAVAVRSWSGRHFDLVSMDDAAYADARVRLTRDVYFSRTGRWLLVLDAVSAPRPVRVQQRWQLPRDRRAGTARGALTTTGPGADLALRWLGTAPVPTVERGLRGPRASSWSGWNSQGYGDLAPSPTAQAEVLGRRVVLATVVLPLAAGEPAPTRPVPGTGSAGPAPSGSGAVPAQVGGHVRGATVTASVRVAGGPLETVTLAHGRVLSRLVTP